MQYGAIPTSLAERVALAAGLVPVPVLDTLFGMMKARAIMAAVDLGVFEALANGPQPPAALAAALHLDAECLELLLRALAFGGYLVQDDARYGLSPLAQKTMLRDAPRSLTGFVHWNYTQWQFAEQLETMLRTGRGVDFHRTLTDPVAWGHYQRAMLETARYDAPIVARHVPVRRGATTLVDLGGSHGLFGATLCRKHPPLRATVVDLPAAIPHAEQLARADGYTDVVDFRAGDLLEGGWGGEWDVALLSNVLHHFQPAQVAQVLSSVHRALVTNGTIAIWELERPDRAARPDAGDGVALFFRLTSTAGAYSGATYADWLREAGFTAIKVVRPRLSPGNVLLHARRAS